MDRSTAIPLRIGLWRVDPIAGEVSNGEETVRVEARTMRLLLCLAHRAGEVVSIDDLLSEVWSGVIVTPDSVYQAVASLRRVLGDDPKRPAYIATVPRLGYRMIANVSLWVDERATANTMRVTLGAATTAQPTPDPAAATTDATTAQATPPAIIAQSVRHTITAQAAPASTAAQAAPASTAAQAVAASAPAQAASAARAARPAFIAVVSAACLALALAFVLRGKATNTPDATANAPAKSVAVLPFLDLTTQDMNEEYFADGMTEELIDKLSQVPGLRVPGPTSSFYFKGKKIKVADIGKSLGVAYVLDGSVRESGDTLRVAARLVRAGDGYVIWSETYDRPMDNRLKVQDEIASEVAKALQASIN